MGLYDGYKLDNSTYISQYVGNLVPELQNFSQVMQKRYNDARDTDDNLTEAMGNLQHLETEEDSTYANELKQTYMTRLMERSGRADYENMGRRTIRDARQFSADYIPLVNRMKGMQAVQERVLQDKEIFSPETKNRILGKIQHMNKTQRDPRTGDFVRDASGKVQLGAIKDWSYAKDVDIDKKNLDILKELQAEENQSGFSTSEDGKLLQSVTRITRTPADIAKLARERMQNDPEVRAMIERDVDLNTYSLSSEQMTATALAQNVSMYDKLKRGGQSDTRIKSFAKANGYSIEAMKEKPLDVQRRNYEKAGRNPMDADADYVRNLVRQQITEPHVDFIANLLKIDKTEIDAKIDPDYAARASAAATAAASMNDNVTPLTMAPDTDSFQNLDVKELRNTAATAVKAMEETKGHLRTAVAEAMGLGKPNEKNLSAWEDQTGRLISDKSKQGELIQKLKASGREQDAMNLDQAFKEYNKVGNKALYAQQKMRMYDEIAEPEMKKLYNVYKNKGFGLSGEEGGAFAQKGKLSYEQFKKDLQTTEVKSGLFGGIKNAKSGVFSSGDESLAMGIAREKYHGVLQELVTKKGKELSASVKNLVFEPTGEGFIKKQTDVIKNGLSYGDVDGTVMGTGERWSDFLRKELGESSIWRTGDNDKALGADQRGKKDSDFNKNIGLLNARISIRERGINGEPVAVVTMPSGKIVNVALDNMSSSLPVEMATRMLAAGGHMMNKSEATYIAQQAAMGAGAASLRNMNAIDLQMLENSKDPYKLNDILYVKVGDAGIEKVGNKTKVYTVMVKDPVSGKFIPTSIKTTNIDDLQMKLGSSVMHEGMSQQGRNLTE